MAHHNHAHHQHRRDRVGNAHQEVRRQDTVINVVYVTASPTFTGKIGGYKTMDGSDDDPSPQPTPIPETTSQAAKASPAVLAQSTSPEEQATSPSTTPVAVAKTTQQPSETTPTQEPTTPLAITSEAVPSKAIASEAVTSEAVTSEAVASEAVSSSASSSSSISKKGGQSETKTLSETLVPSHHAASSTATLESSSAASSINAQPAATSAASSSPEASKASSGGMSGGAKAGLAIGILLLIGALAALIFFCLRRRKARRNEAYSQTLDEKVAMTNEGAAAGLGRSASVQTSATARTAPRLSLRPVTQFLPDLAAQRKSGGNLLAVAGGSARHNAPTSPATDLEKAAAAGQQMNDPANPFGSHAEVSEKVPAQNQPNDSANPFGNHAETSRQLTNASPEPEVIPPAPLRIRTPTPDGKGAAETGFMAAGATGAVAPQHQHAPNPLNLSPTRAASPALSGHFDGGMPSPAGTEFSMTPSSPGSFASGPPPSNVHRIQLDFKPSMDDELSLRAGQLVRLLHEYDDGWALCIRLDRSQQGVAPRTCLSARPVKPRPPPGVRGPPPPGMFPNQPRPSSPASGRASPSPYDQALRANSPSPARGQRSMSPGPYGGGPQRPTIPTPGKRRSNSASAVRERRNSPPGPSPMNPNVQRVPMQLQAVTAPGQVLAQSPPTSVARKPVPGQAM